MWMNSVFSDSDRQKLAGGKEKGKKGLFGYPSVIV
jgi:hypothetical protein